MSKGRLQIKPTLPPEVLAVANERARELGASSLSSLIEAFIRADAQCPVPGLGARVAEVERGMRTDRSDRGREAIEGARDARWKAPSGRD